MFLPDSSLIDCAVKAGSQECCAQLFLSSCRGFKTDIMAIMNYKESTKFPKEQILLLISSLEESHLNLAMDRSEIPLIQISLIDKIFVNLDSKEFFCLF